MSTTKQAMSDIQAAKKPTLKKAVSRKVEASNGLNNDEKLVDEVKKLDQIRDMLFGDDVATLQNKYQTLDKNLDRNVSTLRKELAASVEELKQQVDKRFDQLEKSLRAENSDRLVQNEEISSSLSRASSDLLTKIDFETKRIDQAFDDQQLESTKQLNTMVDSLQDAKVDRKSLAAMFSQFSKELKNS